ncbi:LOW QUALITY PROTEIN: hypothetical protein PHMEG_000181 [Phytophthora megakarya]|uniref:Uncharacterized protein n=1 Tax=Phytophthora megakarya TaxID=4795 RepID=A0A225X4Q5_9STRA|nr:LOW QUALITY PROTEIN: hypothetical protein PHMEG_000181 [Phytophthora megakarya]
MQRGTDEEKARGARTSCAKGIAEMEVALVDYVEENCLYILAQKQGMLRLDFGVYLSTSLISKKLCGSISTDYVILGHVRVEPETYNNEANIAKGRVFREALLAHEKKGPFIIYYDETNFNSTVNVHKDVPVLANALCSICRLQKGSIYFNVWCLQKLDWCNGCKRFFVYDLYDTVKALDVYKERFMGTTIVIILKNAPAHTQTERPVIDRDDLELLRLAPHSPIGCFSELDSKFKAYLAMNTHEMINLPYGEMTERCICMLKRAVDRGISSIDLHLVNKMACHCALSVAAAI